MEDRLKPGTRRGGWALAALAAIAAVTVGWWALALWPLPGEAPAWLLRTRFVCFGAGPDGLPDAGGWLALVGEPAILLGTLLAVWGDAVAAGLRRAARSAAGRLALAVAVLFLAASGAAAGVRVARAAGGGAGEEGVAAPPAASYPRLDREPPPLELVDQHGDTVTLARFRGRPVLVAFAYAHCETVCPVLVRAALRARERAREPRPEVLIVTLDPWRDTPARLPHIAEAWNLRSGARILGGSVPAVQGVLDAWDVNRSRDPRTGEVLHPSLVYIVDPAGRLAFAAPGDEAVLTALLARL